ncbi:modulator of levamisole receptor-1 domain-containing protein [Ditylenchus destructor]|uniref:Modulator of levamisole receptor-1 domain-containing protein n=1 Tax=Ditylenchus destructor TaxID=166010 RepID=A0AAD4MV99_9BILA|nr:modulator of levamisole receptor-1 domain-containing protein [Ditylenchus destructor]
MILIRLFVVFLLLQISRSGSDATSVFEDYEECRDREQFGLKLSLICDPDHSLQKSTLRSLDSLLRDLQNKITCECANHCNRGEGLTDKYVGLLLVTTTAKIHGGEEKGESLNQSAKRVFEDAKLGDDECSNGLLIIYVKDQQKLATYRGNGRFKEGDEDTSALSFLLSSYENESQGENGAAQKGESWAPIIGLTVALVVILIILALLCALCMVKLCGYCCKRGSPRKDKYYVTPRAPSYKSIEPIYIVTPPMSAQHSSTLSSSMHPPPPHHGMPMYHSPYSGSPTPPPPPVGPRPIVTHPPTIRSRSITPTSTHRIRIHPQHSTSTHGSVKSPDQTPQGHKKDRINRTSTNLSRHSNATYYTASNINLPGVGPESYYMEGDGIVALNQFRTPPDVPAHRGALMQQRPSQIATFNPEDPSSNKFPFLDPRRKLETQTKEEFIS